MLFNSNKKTMRTKIEYLDAKRRKGWGKKIRDKSPLNITFKTKYIQPWMSTDASKGLAVPAVLVVPVVYQPINIADPNYKNNCIIVNTIINSKRIMP